MDQRAEKLILIGSARSEWLILIVTAANSMEKRGGKRRPLSLAELSGGYNSARIKHVIFLIP